jgi:hypothetical protein
MADREKAAWLPAPEKISRAELVRRLNQKLRLRAAEIRRLQQRIDGLKTRVGALEP